MRTRVKRLASVPGEGVTAKVGIIPSLLEQRRKVSVELRAKEVSVPRFALEPSVNEPRELASHVRPVKVTELSSQ